VHVSSTHTWSVSRHISQPESEDGGERPVERPERGQRREEDEDKIGRGREGGRRERERERERDRRTPRKRWQLHNCF